MNLRVLAALAALGLAGCGTVSRTPPLEMFSDMKRQLKYQPQAESPLFADGRAARPPVAGTVARGDLTQTYPLTAANPLPLDAATLSRGQERFNIYCAPCHDRTGSGQGIVGQRSSWLANNLTEDRIRTQPDGELFETITHGRRTMPAYRFQIDERDRWAILHYVRALQRAAAGTLADVPPELRGDLR